MKTEMYYEKTEDAVTLVIDGEINIAEIITSHMERQEFAISRGKQKIVECEIVRNGYVNEIWVRANIGGFCEDVLKLTSYYPDEISFSECEFICKTVEEARKFVIARDMAYLRRW